MLMSGNLSPSPSDRDGFAWLEKEVYRHFASGDYPSLYDTIERIVTKHSHLPESFLYYGDIARLVEVRGYGRAKMALENGIKNLEARPEFPGKNTLHLALLQEIEGLLYTHERAHAGAFTKKLAPLREWVILGPYSRYGPADLDHIFLPEITTSLELPGLRKKIIRLDSEDGFFRGKSHIYPEKGVLYAVTTLKAARPLRISIQGEGSYKVYLNGKMALKNRKTGISRKFRQLRVWGSDRITLMIKLLHEPSWDFRVLITDEEDRVHNASADLSRMYYTDAEFLEEMPYPFSHFLENAGNDPAEGNFRLGNYFDEMESREAVRFYRKSLEKKEDPLVRFFLGSALIEYSGGRKDSADYLEGWEILRRLSEKNPHIIPLRYRLFRKLVDERNFYQACLFGRSLKEPAARYLPFRKDYMRLMKALNYEKEFLDECRLLERDFPHGISVPLTLAEYYSGRNIYKSLELCQQILGREYNRKALQLLVHLGSNCERYDDVLRWLKQWDFNQELIKETVQCLIDKGETDRAKNLIFQQIVRCPDPYYYFLLGRISYSRRADPSLYWLKMLDLYPSYYAGEEFLAYKKTGKLTNPFSGLRGGADSRLLQGSLREPDKYSSTILHRGIVFRLNSDGTSRVFVEDIIYLKDQKALEKWGDYRIAFSGNFTPVRIRTYHQDGSYADSYSLQKTDNTLYINLSSLRKKSLVHIAYIVDNPVTEPRKSEMFSLPFTLIQDYDEYVEHFSFRLITPASLKPSVCFNHAVKAVTETRGGETLYCAEMGPLYPVIYESHMGNQLNYLPFVSFSTMKDMRDIFTWYRGLGEGRDVWGDKAPADLFRSEDLVGLIREIYDYVARETDLKGNLLYYPDGASNTFYKKGGTTEDKVFLAKSLLAKKGVTSFLALTSREDMPDTGSFVSPDIFTDVLLYVPLEKDRGVWLDFSSQYYGCGQVSEALVGREAYVLLSDGHEIKMITGSLTGGVSGKYEIQLDENGNARCRVFLQFIGSKGEIRQYFRDKKNNELMINRYFGGFIPSLTVDAFEVVNMDDYRRPFGLSVTGAGYAMATSGKGRMILQPVLSKSSLYDYIRYSKRMYPLVIAKDIREEDEYTYQLPAEYASIQIKDEKSIRSEYGYARIQIWKDRGNPILRVRKKLVVKKQKILPEKYGEFLQFCLKIRNAEYQNLSLSSSDKP